MDVEFEMRTFIVATCLFTSIASHATELRIFEQGITLREDCLLEVRRSDGTMEIKEFPFKNRGTCAFLPTINTNIPRLEFVRGDFVLIVESQLQSDKSCRSEQAALVVSPDGKVSTGSIAKVTGTCGFNERKTFEVLHHDATANQ
jgi:hypothetical protein